MYRIFKKNKDQFVHMKAKTIPNHSSLFQMRPTSQLSHPCIAHTKILLFSSEGKSHTFSLLISMSASPMGIFDCRNLGHGQVSGSKWRWRSFLPSILGGQKFLNYYKSVLKILGNNHPLYPSFLMTEFISSFQDTADSLRHWALNLMEHTYTVTSVLELCICVSSTHKFHKTHHCHGCAWSFFALLFSLFSTQPISGTWNLHAGQEATIRTAHGTIDWFQIGKGICQGCILSPCLFNL